MSHQCIGASAGVPLSAGELAAPDIAHASIRDTLAALHVDPEIGLTRAVAATRRKQHG
jgi:hypothetical protein